MLKLKKTQALTGAVAGGIALLILAQTPSFAAICATQFSTSPAAAKAPAEVRWRTASTHLGGSELNATSSAREKEMEDRAKKMANEVLGIGMHGDTPPIEIFAEDGVGMKYLSHTDGTSGIPTRIVISKLGAAGLLKATMLVPVSGHTGAANARSWSKTDTYSLTTDVSTDQDGNKWGGNHSQSATEQPLVTDAKSLDLVTAQEISIKLSTAHVTRVLYYRSGSGGPGGYWDGRVIELIWDGT